LKSSKGQLCLRFEFTQFSDWFTQFCFVCQKIALCFQAAI
jgi:hypothetical protein